MLFLQLPKSLQQWTRELMKLGVVVDVSNQCLGFDTDEYMYLPSICLLFTAAVYRFLQPFRLLLSGLAAFCNCKMSVCARRPFITILEPLLVIS